jgi:hypothetical protein
MAQILDVNPLTGEVVTFEYHNDTDGFTIGHHQDVTPILEENKRVALDTDKHKRQAKEEWAKYATIPNVVILEWKNKYGVDFFDKNHDKRVFELLEDPEYRYLKRTTYKHVPRR